MLTPSSRPLLILLLLSLLLPAAAAAQDDALTRAQQLQALVTRAARDASPSVARIDVSRSTAYETAPYWGAPARREWEGQLGRFDADAARKKVPADARNRARLLRQIAEHDLSAADAVPESYGSGFVLDPSGLVLTSAHVVRNATRVYVRLPGKRGSWANVHAADPRSDLAVLKLLDPPADLKALPLGNGGAVRTGDLVLCLANEFAPGFRRDDAPTLSSGLVSALRYRIPGKPRSEFDVTPQPLQHYGTLIQTDARTTPGCSGGALLGLDGKVIGLTTAIAAVRGDRPGGLAIPFDTNTKRILAALQRGEEVEYGFLGVSLPRQGARFGGGVPVGLVSEGTPAYSAGLASGDTILRIDGKPIKDNDDLLLHIGMALAGHQVRLDVRRQTGQTRTLTATLAKGYYPGRVIASKRPAARFGLRVDYRSVLLARNFWPTRQPTSGVIVREVVPGGAADKARLQPDKVITAVDDATVNTPAEYYEAVRKAGKKVTLTYLNSRSEPATMTLEEE